MYLQIKLAVSVTKSDTDEKTQQWETLAPLHPLYVEAIQATLIIMRDNKCRFLPGERLTIVCPRLPRTTFELVCKGYEREVVTPDGKCTDPDDPCLQAHFTIKFTFKVVD